MKKILFVIFLLFILLSLKTISLNHQKAFLKDRLHDVENENKSLRSKLQDLEENFLQLQIEGKVSRLRELPFIKEPVYREVDRKTLHEKLVEEIQDEYPKQDIETTQKVLVKFGFLEPNYNLKDKVINIYGEQIGAFYDVDEKALFKIKGLGIGQGLQNAILAHELTHALQDQHFRIKNLVDSNLRNDDQKLAHLSLVEGDASFVTQLYYLHSMKLSVLWDILSYFFVDQKEFKNAPLVLQQNMIFPYLKGIEFVSYIYHKSGWSGINRCFQKPPSSTEEILHPDKYLADNDAPQMIVFPSLKEVLSPYVLLEENVIGEFNIRLLFEKFFKSKAFEATAEGWGGDTYQVWEDKTSSSLILIWLTHWDTPQDANQFFNGYSQLVLKKFPDASQEVKIKDKNLWKTPQEWILILKNGKGVLVIEANEKPSIEKMSNSFEEFKDKNYN
ncbi:MAG: hypothetical protein HYS07_02290 [Chlamydiae bacterium]|nr:hypothetical protein [Chlamydiota bacterium]MBI3276722.1 hypothetical protein [Chlamydiota bacterium]